MAVIKEFRDSLWRCGRSRRILRTKMVEHPFVDTTSWMVGIAPIDFKSLFVCETASGWRTRKSSKADHQLRHVSQYALDRAASWYLMVRQLNRLKTPARTTTEDARYPSASHGFHQRRRVASVHIRAWSRASEHEHLSSKYHLPLALCLIAADGDATLPTADEKVEFHRLSFTLASALLIALLAASAGGPRSMRPLRSRRSGIGALKPSPGESTEESEATRRRKHSEPAPPIRFALRGGNFPPCRFFENVLCCAPSSRTKHAANQRLTAAHLHAQVVGPRSAIRDTAYCRKYCSSSLTGRHKQQACVASCRRKQPSIFP